MSDQAKARPAGSDLSRDESAQSITLFLTWIGLLLHGLFGVVILLSGLFAQLVAVVILWTTWVGLTTVSFRYRRTRPALIALSVLLDLAGVWLGWKLGR